MYRKKIVSFTASMMLIGTAALAAEKAAPIPVEAAAQAASVQTLRELGRQSGPRPAGMPPLSQMDKTTLGEPYAVKMVRLDHLQRYQPMAQADLAALLQDQMTTIYPIQVADQVYGEMVMGKVDGVWSARGFGGPEHVQALEKVRGHLKSAAGIPSGATMLVRVPSLNIEFVGYSDATGLQLTPITDLATAGLSAGQTLSAARVFELLVPLARQHNGLPT